MTPSIPSTTSTTGANATTGTTNSSSATTAASVNANEQTFMQLLVAELQNQDPTNPTDGTEFVTQLAEFQQLSTTMTMATDVSGIHSDADQLVADATATAATSTGNTSSTQS